ncbi:MAG: T9SS type A sorting domain-containing protein, partial [Bacteroidia bacterium]|nr:T9SS type A sorting domain-containing protein [Bacteroidia bacterium]
ANGCKATSSTFIVSINENPNPVISGAGQVCENGTYAYNLPANQNRVYLWTASNGVVQSGQGTSSVNVTWNTGFASGTLYVKDSSATTGCVSISLPKNVIINPIPTPVILGKVAVCTGEKVVYNTPGNSGRQFTWTVTNGLIISGAGTNVVTVLWTNAGTGVLNVMDSNTITGCHATATAFTTNISASPAGTITGVLKACNNSIENYSVEGNSASNYTWSVFNGSIVTGQGTNNVTIKWSGIGTGVVIINDSIVTTGCSTLGADTITINPLPNAGFTTSQSQGIVTFTPQLSGLTYHWTFGDGDSSKVQSPVHTYASNKFYAVNLQATNANGCSNDSLINVQVKTVGLQSVLAGKFDMSVYPNPFHGRTLISFNLHEASSVSLEIFDMTGRLIKTFVTGESYASGLYEFTFDADQIQTASSMYLVRLKVNDTIRFLKIMEADRN